MAAAVLAGGVRFVVDRSQVRAAERRPVRTQRALRLPERLPALLQRRAEWLKGDLAVAPQQPVLLAAMAEAALALAQVHQATNPDLAAYWRDEARRYVARLETVASELCPPLEHVLQAPRSTAWAPPGNGNLVSISPRTRDDRAYRILVESGSGPMVAAVAAQVSPVSGALPPARAISNSPGMDYPLRGSPQLGNVPAGSMGMASFGASAAPVLTIPNTPSAAAAHAEAAPLAELKAAAEARPRSALAASQYARALEARAEGEVRELPAEQRREALHARLREAGRMYQKAAENARLRTYRAAFLCAAGDAYRRANEPELQYAVLRRAVAEVPISAPIWRDLQAACLRTGRVRESEEAWRESQEWSLPVLRIMY